VCSVWLLHTSRKHWSKQGTRKRALGLKTRQRRIPFREDWPFVRPIERPTQSMALLATSCRSTSPPKIENTRVPKICQTDCPTLQGRRGQLIAEIGIVSVSKGKGGQFSWDFSASNLLPSASPQLASSFSSEFLPVGCKSV